MALFNLGDFVLHSGARSGFKIDCDALADEGIKALAAMIRQMVGEFCSVEGVPTGGLRLATALQPLCGRRMCHLIVDDVLTSGASMEQARQAHGGQGPAGRPGIVGAVVFARDQCPL